MKKAKRCSDDLAAALLQFKDNQSRICGKGVGLGLSPFDSLKSQNHTNFLKLHTKDHTMV